MAILKKTNDEMARPFGKNNYCIECEEPIIQPDGTPLSGGYWSYGADKNLCPCTHCAHHSDLHNLGYVIGDALMAGHYFNPVNPDIREVVEKVIGRIEKSVLKAIVFQMQNQIKSAK